MASRLLLDANLAVLFAVGATNESYIAKHKRLTTFDIVDYKIVCNLIALSAGLVFTPNVLTETSNLIRYIADPIRSETSAVFAGIVRRVDEEFIPSRVAVARGEHIRLGVTDSVLLALATGGATLLTVDLDLYLAALDAGLGAVNYNHVRREQRPDY